MKPLTRKNVMFNGIMKKRSKDILMVGKKEYRVTDFLAKRIQRKKWLLGLMTVIFTFIYMFALEPFRDIPFEGVNERFMEGMSITFLFLAAIVLGFVSISLLLLPKDIEEHVIEEFYMK